MNYTRAQVKKLLYGSERTLHVDRVTERYQRVYTAKDVYEVFYLVYDATGKVIVGFNMCRICKELLDGDKSSAGMSHLKRHKCYKEYIKQKAAESEEEDEEVILPAEENDEEETQTSEEHSPVKARGRSTVVQSNGPTSLTLNQRHNLATAIIECSEQIAKHGKISVDKLEKIIPSTLNDNQW